MIPSDPHRFPDDVEDVAELLRSNRPEATALELDGIYRQVNSRVRKGQNSMKSRFAMMAMLVSGLLMSGTGAGLAVTGISAQDNAAGAQYPCSQFPQNKNCTPDTTTTPPVTTTQRSVPCDANGDQMVSKDEAANSTDANCQMDDSGTLPTTTTGGDSCDRNGNGVISPGEAKQQGCGEVKGATDEDSAPADSNSDEPNEDSAVTPNTDREQGAQPTRQVEASNGDELPFTGFAAIPILVGGMALLAGGLVLRRRTITE